MEVKQRRGETRRLHIIYFLSRMGRVEQPHLIRIHHPATNGVYLKDVKRWLSEVRGKELTESFAWSYKRRYKAGYLWQDLLNDDLITPISDNEFVLKGSEIPSNAGDRTQALELENGQKYCTDNFHDPRLRKTSPPSPDIIEESAQFGSESLSASMEYTMKKDEKSVAKEAMDNNGEKGEEDSCHSRLLTAPRNRKMGSSLGSLWRYMPQTSNGSGRKSKSSSILKNLSTCCAVDTDDSATVPINQSIKKNSRHDHGPKKCKEDNGEYSCLKPVSAAYRPVSYPTCSHCGKPFKPEKLLSHMKSCRGMKMFAKNAAASTSAARSITSHQSHHTGKLIGLATVPLKMNMVANCRSMFSSFSTDK